jgi:hypothetical protein
VIVPYRAVQAFNYGGIDLKVGDVFLAAHNATIGTKLAVQVEPGQFSVEDRKLCVGSHIIAEPSAHTPVITHEEEWSRAAPTLDLTLRINRH